MKQPKSVLLAGIALPTLLILTPAGADPFVARPVAGTAIAQLSPGGGACPDGSAGPCAPQGGGAAGGQAETPTRRQRERMPQLQAPSEPSLRQGGPGGSEIRGQGETPRLRQRLQERQQTEQPSTREAPSRRTLQREQETPAGETPRLRERLQERQQQEAPSGQAPDRSERRQREQQQREEAPSGEAPSLRERLQERQRQEAPSGQAPDRSERRQREQQQREEAPSGEAPSLRERLQERQRQEAPSGQAPDRSERRQREQQQREEAPSGEAPSLRERLQERQRQEAPSGQAPDRSERRQREQQRREEAPSGEAPSLRERLQERQQQDGGQQDEAPSGATEQGPAGSGEPTGSDRRGRESLREFLQERQEGAPARQGERRQQREQEPSAGRGEDTRQRGQQPQEEIGEQGGRDRQRGRQQPGTMQPGEQPTLQGQRPAPLDRQRGARQQGAGRPGALLTPQQLQARPPERVFRRLLQERETQIERIQRNPRGARVVRQEGDRVILRRDNDIIVQHNDVPRIARHATNIEINQIQNNWTQTTIVRNDVRIINVTNEYGEVISRRRILPDGTTMVLFDNTRWYEQQHPIVPVVELPPLQLTIPQERYIVEATRASPEIIRETLLAPPMTSTQRTYSLPEVLYNRRVREEMPRIDLDTITFETGSAEIPPDQVDKLQMIGETLADIIDQDPRELILIEGHTDAVGSAEANLELSDRRAESVASLLTEFFQIPPENLVTQGYGEQYLKVDTQGPSRENRRVTLRRITPLVTGQSQ